MGLFSRKNPYEKDALDLETAMRDTPERPDLRPRQAPMPPLAMQVQAPAPAVAQQTNTAATKPPQVAAPAPKPSYGIEDAIRLMRELPDNKKEMVITIVQKTLISAKINVHSIVEDAVRKIDRLEKKNDKLGQEVRELEEAILQRKMEIEKNGRDIEETIEVKQSFESIQPRPMDEPMARPSSSLYMGHSPSDHNSSPAQAGSAEPHYVSNQKAS